MKLSKPLLASAALGLILSACTTDSSKETEGAGSNTGESPACNGKINISGSSTVEPISVAVGESYEQVCDDNVEITVAGPGTGDGFQAFCAGDTDISNASRTIKDSEAADCADAGIEYTELKVAIDGISIMTNPKNEAVECVSFADLYALLGEESKGFDKWDDANALAAELGSSAEFDSDDLKIHAPGTESGTYDSMSELVLEEFGKDRLDEEVDGGYIRKDIEGNSDDNVIIEGIAGDDSSLGWVGFAFADANKDTVKTLAVSEEPDGDCVEPNPETIADGSYPISRELYIYINNAKASENAALTGFVDHYLGDGYTQFVTEPGDASGYVPLGDDVLAEMKMAWDEAKS